MNPKKTSEQKTCTGKSEEKRIHQKLRTNQKHHEEQIRNTGITRGLGTKTTQAWIQAKLTCWGADEETGRCYRGGCETGVRRNQSGEEHKEHSREPEHWEHRPAESDNKTKGYNCKIKQEITDQINKTIICLICSVRPLKPSFSFLCISLCKSTFSTVKI